MTYDGHALDAALMAATVFGPEVLHGETRLVLGVVRDSVDAGLGVGVSSDYVPRYVCGLSRAKRYGGRLVLAESESGGRFEVSGFLVDRGVVRLVNLKLTSGGGEALLDYARKVVDLGPGAHADWGVGEPLDFGVSSSTT